ncbi:MAG: Clp protease N-terminal domain-containing protein [Rubrobacteraceae bacterium]
MFESFTERARKVVVLAQEEARHFAHNYIGTEHLLLGLIREEDGVAAQSLRAVNVSLDGVREQVEGIVGYGEEGTGGQAPFTRRSKKVLELALREALQLGHNYIGTEHILLGLVRESEGVAARVLNNLDVDPDKVRRGVLQSVGEGSEFDSLDQIETEMEDEDIVESQISSRSPSGSLRVGVRVKGRVRTLLVYLGYAFADTVERSETTDHDEILGDVAETLEGRGYRSLQMAVVGSGELVLERFPKVREVEVNAMRERFFERRTGSGIILSATFHR